VGVTLLTVLARLVIHILLGEFMVRRVVAVEKVTPTKTSNHAAF